jgi:hypothetical protein
MVSVEPWSSRLGQGRRRQQCAEAREQRSPPDHLRYRSVEKRAMLVESPPPIVIDYASARIGPDRLELDLPPELGDGSPAAQNGGAFPQQACALKNPFLLGVYHRS